MTRDEHERERRAFWDRCYIAYLERGLDETIAEWANNDLAERDKRWPAPEETIKAGVDPETEEADNCDTCEFSILGPFQEPCRSCRTVTLSTESFWRPIK